MVAASDGSLLGQDAGLGRNNQHLEGAVFEAHRGACLGDGLREAYACDWAAWDCGQAIRLAALVSAPAEVIHQCALLPLASPDFDLQIRRLGWVGDRLVRHYEHHADYYYYFPEIAFINRIIIIKNTSKIYQFIIYWADIWTQLWLEFSLFN